MQICSNGDKVNKNDDLAMVDRVTLMQAISDVQETMDYLRKESAGIALDSKRKPTLNFPRAKNKALNLEISLI